MAVVKVAISIEQALFREAERTARQLRLPRSRVFALALDYFLRQRREEEFIGRINRAYADGPSREDRRVQKAMQARLNRIVSAGIHTYRSEDG